jgi:hypothetical protein
LNTAKPALQSLHCPQLFLIRNRNVIGRFGSEGLKVRLKPEFSPLQLKTPVFQAMEYVADPEGYTCHSTSVMFRAVKILHALVGLVA